MMKIMKILDYSIFIIEISIINFLLNNKINEKKIVVEF